MEKYKPSRKEVEEAEDMMTHGEKEMSRERIFSLLKKEAEKIREEIPNKDEEEKPVFEAALNLIECSDFGKKYARIVTEVSREGFEKAKNDLEKIFSIFGSNAWDSQAISPGVVHIDVPSKKNKMPIAIVLKLTFMPKGALHGVGSAENYINAVENGRKPFVYSDKGNLNTESFEDIKLKREFPEAGSFESWQEKEERASTIKHAHFYNPYKEKLIQLPKIIDAAKKGTISLLRDHDFGGANEYVNNYKLKDFANSPEFKNAARNGLINLLRDADRKSDGYSYLEYDLKPGLASIKYFGLSDLISSSEVRSAAKEAIIKYRGTDSSTSDFDDVPEKIAEYFGISKEELSSLYEEAEKRIKNKES